MVYVDQDCFFSVLRLKVLKSIQTYLKSYKCAKIVVKVNKFYTFMTVDQEC